MEIACPSCEKKLLLKLEPDLHCTLWCGTCGQEVPDETLTDAGAPPELLARLAPWAAQARELLEVEEEGTVGGDRSDIEYIRDWKGLRDETEDLLRRLREFLPAGTGVFGTPKPPAWSDSEIRLWRRQRGREGLLFQYGYQKGAHYVDEGGLPLAEADDFPAPYPPACVTASEKRRFREGFVLGTQMGTFDAELHTEIETEIRRR